MELNKIKVLELFCGYGTSSFALKRLGIDFELIGYSDIDQYANQCFKQNHITEDQENKLQLGDVKNIDTNKLEDFDLLTGGFPCQDVSVAGKRDLSKGRTNLYLEVLRIAEAKKPKYMLLENVKGLLSMNLNTDKLENKLIDKIVRDLKSLGYGVCWKVLNSKNYGTPQNRERVWFVCKYGGWDFMEFQFPEKIKLNIFIKDILENKVNKKYYLSEKLQKRFNNYILEKNKKVKDDGLSITLTEPHHNNLRLIEGNVTLLSGLQKNQSIKQDGVSNSLTSAMGLGGGHVPMIIDPKTNPNINTIYNDKWVNNRVYGTNGLSPTINVKESKDIKISDPKTNSMNLNNIPCLRSGTGSGNKLIVFNLQPISATRPSLIKNPNAGGSGIICKTDGTIDNTIYCNGQLRRLTPKECFRLMGFFNDEIDISGLSDTQAYKLAGNGQDVNVVSLIYKNMFKV